MLNLNKFLNIDFNKQTLHKKWSFPFWTSSINVTKSAVPVDLATFTEEIGNGKLHFLCSEKQVACALGKCCVCLDYSNMQEGINISKLYMSARWHLFPTWSWKWMCLMVFSTRYSNRNIIGLKWVSRCHTKPTWATFSAYVIVLFLNILRHLPWQLSRVDVS